MNTFHVSLPLWLCSLVNSSSSFSLVIAHPGHRPHMISTSPMALLFMSSPIERLAVYLNPSCTRYQASHLVTINSKDYKESHGSILCYYRTNVKETTQLVTITLLDKTRLDKMGVDKTSIRWSRIRQTGPNWCVCVLMCAQLFLSVVCLLYK